MLENVKRFLEEQELRLVKKIARGWSSEIFLAENSKGKKFILKAEREKSTRFKMAEREAENLRKANSAGIGPKLAGFDLEKRIILMEAIAGQTFSEWLFGGKPGKKELLLVTRELMRQAKKLDEIGLDHGQLAGKGKNILVQRSKPVIIDFEKASSNRKCHNLSTIEGFLFKNPRSAIAAKVRETLGLQPALKAESQNLNR